MRHIELTAIVAMLYACVTGGAYSLVKVLLAVEMRVPQEHSTVFQIQHIQLTW